MEAALLTKAEAPDTSGKAPSAAPPTAARQDQGQGQGQTDAATTEAPAKEEDDVNSTELNNVPFTILGASLLWVGWCGYVLSAFCLSSLCTHLSSLSLSLSLSRSLALSLSRSLSLSLCPLFIFLSLPLSCPTPSRLCMSNS